MGQHSYHEMTFRTNNKRLSWRGSIRSGNVKTTFEISKRNFQIVLHYFRVRAAQKNKARITSDKNKKQGTQPEIKTMLLAWNISF